MKLTYMVIDNVEYEVIEGGRRDGCDGCNGENDTVRATVAIVATVADRKG